jgi:IS30 family transposase
MCEMDEKRRALNNQVQYSLIEYRVAMEKHYHHLSTTDRVTLMFLKRQGLSLRAIASELNRSPSTLSRELQRRAVEGRPYDAEAAGLAARSARLLCRPQRKLVGKRSTNYTGMVSP